MRGPIKSSLSLIVTAGVVGGLVMSVVRDRTSEPYVVPRSALAGWTVVTGQPEDAWIVAARPPASLTDSLFRQLASKARTPVIAPPRPDLPLVLRAEYADALQGVWSTDEIVGAAESSQIETAMFEPVCVAHKIRTDETGSAELFFIALMSTAFERFRDDLQPDFPEHAGVTLYDPRALPALIPIAATDRRFDQWWPITFDPLTDCQAQLTIR